MKTKILKLVSVIVFICMSFIISAENTIPKGTFRFKHLGTDNGLSYNNCLALLQDSQGFLWVGTEDGLNRYTGRDFEIFRHDSHSETSLSDSFITALAEIDNNDIWIGTFEGGINIYDRNNGHFKHVPLETPSTGEIKSIIHIFQDSEGYVWIGTRGNGVVQITTDGQIINHFTPGQTDEKSSYGTSVRGTVEESIDSVIFATTKGLCRFNKRTKTLEIITDTSGKAHYTITVFKDSRGVIYAGSYTDGLMKLDSNGQHVSHLPDCDSKQLELLKQISPYTITEDSRGILWIGCYRKGLVAFNPVNQSCVHIAQNNNFNDSLVQDTVVALIIDSSKILWIGTRIGLDTLDLKTLDYINYSTYNSSDSILCDNYISSFEEDGDGNVWVGTDRCGITRINLNTGLIDNVVNTSTRDISLSSDTVISLQMDNSKNILYVGTWEGLDIYNLSENTIRHLDKSAGLKENRIFSLDIDQNNRLWVGTYGGGLYSLDYGSKRFKSYAILPEKNGLPNDEVFSILAEDDRTIWVGCLKGGLSKVNADSGDIQIFPLQTNNGELLDTTIFSICSYSNTFLYLATPKGLVRFNKKNGNTRTFDMSDGLVNNSIIGILKDNKNNLWISTFMGLSCFDPATETFRNFNSDNGLPINMFEEGAYFLTQNNTLLLGTTNEGFLAVNTQHLKTNPHIPNTYISYFSSETLTINPFQLLEKTTPSLPYSDKHISFEFISLEFTNPQNNLFSYRLKGLEKEFSTASDRNYVSYTNLSPGEYTFQVKSSNSDRVWNTTPAELTFNIKTPWWLTWPALTLAAILFSIISYFIIRGFRKLIKIFSHWHHSHFFSHFRIIKKLGEGGMGTVYLVTDLKDDSEYALKKLNDMHIFDEDTRQRFLRESLLHEKLNHPNAVNVYEKGEVDDSLYFTMDYINGITFNEIIAEKPLKWSTAFTLMAPVFEIISEIHQMGVIHRDLKPSNLMIDEGLRTHELLSSRITYNKIKHHIHILDFGIAKIMNTQTMTKTGSLMGSLAYMPPEIIFNNSPADQATDYYALGVTLFQMCTGNLPIQGNELWEMLHKAGTGQLLSPGEINSNIPESASNLIMTLIDSNPDNRLKDPVEILKHLNQISK